MLQKLQDQIDRMELQRLPEHSVPAETQPILPSSQFGSDHLKPEEGCSTSTIPRKEIDQAMKAVDNYSLPNKFKGHSDSRSSHVWEIELRRTIRVHGGSPTHLYFAMVKTLSHDLLLSSRMMVPEHPSDQAFTTEVNRVFECLHSRFGGEFKAALVEENIAKLQILNDESITKFLERLERLRLEYDLSHPGYPLSDDRLKSILQYALSSRSWTQSVISANRLFANFDTLSNELILQEPIAGQRRQPSNHGGNHVNNLRVETKKTIPRSCFRCGKDDCKDVNRCNASTPINYKGRCKTCGWDITKSDSHTCVRSTYTCGRCRGPHSTYVCPNSTSPNVNALSTDIDIFSYEVADSISINTLNANRALKTTNVFLSVDKTSVVCKGLLDTGAGISCISLAKFQELGGRIGKLDRIKIRYANRGVGMGYGPTELSVGLSTDDAHPLQLIVVPDLAYDCILNTDILRRSRSVWVFHDEGDFIVTNNCRHFKKLLDVLESKQPPRDTLDEIPVLQELTLNHLEMVHKNENLILNEEDLLIELGIEPIIEIGEGHLRATEDRFVFTLPWKGSRRPGRNFAEATQRDYRLIRSLRQKNLLDTFQIEIEKFVSQGYCRRASSAEVKYFIPCFPVKKKDSATPRVVFDARELNHYLEIDEVVCRSTLPSLLVFRHFQHFACTDLASAFLQIRIPPSDSEFCGFVFNGEVFVMTRLLFGLTSSPAGMTQAADMVIQGMAERLSGLPKNEFAVSVYIDDITVGGSSPAVCVTVFNAVVDGFEHYGFMQNSTKLFSNTIPSAGDRKILGYKWSREQDSLNPNVPFDHVPNCITMSTLQHLIPRFYDPLGTHLGAQLLGRYILRSGDSTRFNTLVDAVINANPTPRFAPITSVLFVFCDASALAQASLLFNAAGQLIMGRGCLASIPPQSMPREELNALVQAVTTVVNLLEHLRQANIQLPLRAVICSDSLLNIQRVRRPKSRQDEYVNNRLKTIMDSVHGEDLQWTFYHIPGELNPADIPSRLGVESPNAEAAITFISKVIENDLEVHDTRGVTFRKDRTHSDTLKVLNLEIFHVDPVNGTEQDFSEIKRRLLESQREADVGDGFSLARWGERVIVPDPVAAIVVEYIHRSSGHLGQSNLKKLINRAYAIKGISRVVNQVCSRCPLCQVLKGNRHPSNLEHNGWADQQLNDGSWRTVGLDIYSFDTTHMLSATDLLSRLIVIEVVKVSSLGYTSRDIAEAFERICYRTGYGFPSVVYTDNEPVFGSSFARFLKINGVVARRVSHYSPFTTFWERLHAEVTKQLKVLTMSTSSPPDQGMADKAAFIINRRPGPCEGMSAIEAFMLKFQGRSPWDLNRLYQDFDLNSDESLGRELKERQNQTVQLYERYLSLYRRERYRSTKRKGLRTVEPLRVGDHVLVYNSRGTKKDPRWQYPPLVIIENVGLKHYRLDNGSVEHEYNLKRFME